MFDPAEKPAAVPGDARAAAVARLASIATDFPPIDPERRFRRARRLAPGVYRPAGRYGPVPTTESSNSDGDTPWVIRSDDAGSGRAPGPLMAAVLDRTVPGGLSSHDLLDGVAGWERLIGWAHA
ncbi:MAG TPA: hypothetical protein VIQ02_05415, partial [Jiangellaceae bacterium]